MYIEGRKYIIHNEIYVNFMDYVATIKPHFNKDNVSWNIVFSNGYDKESKPINCADLENAFNLIEQYSKLFIKFDELLNELEKNKPIK